MKEIEGERWKQIPGFYSYMVSNMGRVLRETLSGPKELKGKTDRLGYKQVGITKNGKQHWVLMHRLVACTFANPNTLSTTDSGEFLTVNHKNRIKTDNRLDNLELVTVAQNHQHWRKHSLEKMSHCVGAIGDGPPVPHGHTPVGGAGTV